MTARGRTGHGARLVSRIDCILFGLFAVLALLAATLLVRGEALAAMAAAGSAASALGTVTARARRGGR